ncbi:bacteriophage spanin2 family protein [Saccharothrix obliqua]|uniref:bacteriophage spanin2 family protein n=1 Tax=Saccharothrix obliqua TaxID=2861747 RepID=UPI001C5DFA7F|nr:bacteriophage spanin2 family protein [Saccharothrix obliqua]MBW4716087.1 bacteriophage spanin2 family protein [Saccharothrix obliqua]
MRAGRPVATILLALGLVGAVSGCEAVQEASNAANQASQGIDKAKLCVDALALAGFTPSAADPQKAVDETKAKAEELSKLAEKAGDTTLRDAITGVSDSMSKVTLSDLDPTKFADWTQQKLDQVAKLSAACGG